MKRRYGAVINRIGMVGISVYAESFQDAKKIITDELTRNPENISRIQAYNAWKNLRFQIVLED